jgi:tetratricopeptide (TPR) repeat protein
MLSVCIPSTVATPLSPERHPEVVLVIVPGAHPDQQAVTLDNALGPAWYHLGVAQEGLRRYEEAVESFRRALKIDARNGDAWYHAGGTLYHLGRTDEALRAFDRAAKLSPRDPRPWYNRGCILSERGEFAPAVEAFDRALEIRPGESTAWFQKGIVLGMLGRMEEATVNPLKSVKRMLTRSNFRGVVCPFSFSSRTSSWGRMLSRSTSDFPFSSSSCFVRSRTTASNASAWAFSRRTRHRYPIPARSTVPSRQRPSNQRVW